MTVDFGTPLFGNPKKVCGDLKPGLHFVPSAPMFDVAEVMRLGARKYGIKNWHKQPIRASTYYDAIFRHGVQWFELMEDSDIESSKSHLAHIICCCLILMDSQRLGILIDDRGESEAFTKGVGE